MANIFDYLKDVAYDSFYDLPLNELDILALTEITYLSFDHLVSTTPMRLLDLAPQVPREPNMLTSKNRLQLLDELAQHKRFKNCKLSHFINEIDPELQKQFAAMTYRLTLDTYLIVFRGTDDSIIGWKEDFHLTYMKEIPAQKHALRYLKNFFARHPKQKVILAGHSKGGNLAIYAASQIEQSLQNQITAVYTFDAPGLHKELTQKEGYQRIMDRTKVFIPQGSIIGMMLEIPAHQIIVHSTALGGIAQHDRLRTNTLSNWIRPIAIANKSTQPSKNGWPQSLKRNSSSTSTSSLVPFLMLALTPSMTYLPSKLLNTSIISLSKLNPSLQKKGKPWDALPNY